MESIAEPTGEAWLVQLQQAAQAGQAPADVSMMSQVAMLKGQATDLWAPLDLAQDPQRREPRRRSSSTSIRTAASPASARWPGTSRWSPTPTPIPTRRTSWAALWDPANEDKLGLLALVSNSFLLEVTAKTFFGGTNALDTEEGILEALDKLAEVKPNVRLWYRDEAQFEQALKSGEIPMGQYYHDVTGLAAADGFPVRSTFPKEGGVLDSGSWARQPRLREDRGGARLHRLYEPAGDPGADVAQGRHLADGARATARSDRRGIRRGVLRHRADHPALRPLPDRSPTG